MTETTTDSIFKGKIIIQQPKNGFRFGIDAIFLGAAVPRIKALRILDLGSGVGTALFSGLYQQNQASGLGVERDAALVELARSNARANGCAHSVDFIAHDLFSKQDPLKGHQFDCVISNPPFYDAAHNPKSPIKEKSLAKNIDAASFDLWIEYGLKKTQAKGYFMMLIATSFLPRALRLCDERLGKLRIFPMMSKPGEPAKRVIIAGQKGYKSPFTLMPGMTIHQRDGRYTKEAYAVLQEGLPIPLF